MYDKNEQRASNGNSGNSEGLYVNVNFTGKKTTEVEEVEEEEDKVDEVSVKLLYAE
jgi:hypothetical protein